MKLCDEDLLAALASNLDDHFPQLVQTYQHQLYTFALRLTGNVHDAEEIVQEAFLLAYHAMEGYPVQRVQTLKLRQWLYAITRNYFYNTLRKPTLQTFPLDISEESTHLDIIDEHSSQPEREAEKAETRHEFGQLVSQLPTHYREAITLYYFEDFSYKEMAELLQQPSNTVKSHVHRGVRLLRQLADANVHKAG